MTGKREMTELFPVLLTTRLQSHSLPQIELFAKSSISRRSSVVKSGLPIRRAEKITPRLGFLCCSGAYCDFREARKGPECGRFATYQRKNLWAAD
jgi:hypothetical protein